MKFIKENWFIITIILLIIIVGIFGYFGFKYYQKYQNEKVVKEKEAQALSDQQQQALQKAQTEIDNLKTQVDSSKTTQNIIQQKIDQIKNQASETPKVDYSINTTDLAPYLTGVVQVFCNGERGSGSLQKYEGVDSYSVVTNQHVIENPFSNGFCFIIASDSNERGIGVYLINTKEKAVWNDKTDVASIPLHPFTDPSFFANDRMFLLCTGPLS